MKLFFDHNISFHIARGISEIVGREHEVVALVDKFANDASVSDEAWLSQLSREGDWWVASNDHRIRKNPAQREALRRCSVRMLFLAPGWHKVPVTEQAARFLLWWPKLIVQNALIAAPALFEMPIGAGGKLRQLGLG